MADASKPKGRLEQLRHVVEIVALVLAGGYFLFRMAGGWFWESVSLDIETERVHAAPGSQEDLLKISVSIENGIGSLRIHDAAARVTFGTELFVERFKGLTRHKTQNRRLIMGRANPMLPEAGLGPNQKTEFATFVRVPRDAVCDIEVAALVHRKWTISYPQALASDVSLPID